MKVKNKELSQIYMSIEYKIYFFIFYFLAILIGGKKYRIITNIFEYWIYDFIYIYIYIWMRYIFWFELWFDIFDFGQSDFVWLWYPANVGYSLVLWYPNQCGLFIGTLIPSHRDIAWQ